MVRPSYLRQILISFCSLEKFVNNSEFPQGSLSLVSGPYFIFFHACYGTPKHDARIGSGYSSSCSEPSRHLPAQS